MKCANCDADALYIHQITLEVFTPFCAKHLPKFLEPLKKAGNLKTTEVFKKEKELAHAALQPKPEEIVEEKPTPNRKPKSKNASDS